MTKIKLSILLLFIPTFVILSACSRKDSVILPSMVDTDGDTLTDEEEEKLGTDPTNGDTDQDGISDDDEIIEGSDPKNDDSDGDGVADGAENEEETNPSNTDTDDDGLSDSDEAALSTNPNDTDSDDDGLLDSADTYPLDSSNGEANESEKESEGESEEENGGGNGSTTGHIPDDPVSSKIYSGLCGPLTQSCENDGEFGDYTNTYGDEWGSTSHFVTDIEMNKSLIALSRYANNNNDDAWILDGNLQEQFGFGGDFKDNLGDAHVTAVSFCDMNGDGEDGIVLAVGDNSDLEISASISRVLIMDQEYDYIYGSLSFYYNYDINGDNDIYNENDNSDCESCENFDYGDSATDVDCGDIDGDGKDEVVVATSSKNPDEPRAYVVEYDQDGTFSAYGIGEGTNASGYSSSVAVGDIDGDDRSEIIVGIQETEYSSNSMKDNYAEYIIYDDESSGFDVLKRGMVYGEPTRIDTGDVDGDGIDEIGISTDTTQYGEYRYYILKYENGDVTQILKGGDDIPEGSLATDISMGDIDGDGKCEVAVSFTNGETNSDNKPLVYVLNDYDHDFSLISQIGSDFDAYANAVAIGDLDSDGYGELILGLGGVEQGTPRVYLYKYSELTSGLELNLL